MCVLSRPLRSRDILKSYGGTKKNSLNKFPTSDEIDTDIDLSSSSPYVSIECLPNYLSDVRDNLSFFSLNAQSLPAKFDKIIRISGGCPPQPRNNESPLMLIVGRMIVPRQDRRYHQICCH